MKKIVILLLLLLPVAHLLSIVHGQVRNFDFDMTKPQPNYNEDTGFVTTGILSLYPRNKNSQCFFPSEFPKEIIK